MNHIDDPGPLAPLARILWRSHSEPDRVALIQPTASFPDGTLLGRFRLDPLDPARTVGPPVDVLAGTGGAVYAPIRDALLERAGRSAMVTTATLDDIFEIVEEHWCGPWDAPWQLIGLTSPELIARPPVDVPEPERFVTDALGLVRLVPTGLGHPGDALTGLVAPPPVFGLWLVHEGYERDDAGRRIGEIRMHLVVLADGRWGLRSVRRPDSPYRPRPDSTVAGGPVTVGDRTASTAASFAHFAHDAVAGVIPEILARVMQVAVSDEVDPYETLLRIFARGALGVVRDGGSVADLARIDPVAVAYAGVALIDRVDATAASIDELTARLERVTDLVETLVTDLASRAVVGDGDWLDESMLARVEPGHARHTAAGIHRVAAGVGDVDAAWLGTELMAGRASAHAGPVGDSIDALARMDQAIARQVAHIVEHRRQVWGVADDDRTTTTRMLLAGAVGRNDPCPCSSGRKAKHCCRR